MAQNTYELHSSPWQQATFKDNSVWGDPDAWFSQRTKENSRNMPGPGTGGTGGKPMTPQQQWEQQQLFSMGPGGQMYTDPRTGQPVFMQGPGSGWGAGGPNGSPDWQNMGFQDFFKGGKFDPQKFQAWQQIMDAYEMFGGRGGGGQRDRRRGSESMRASAGGRRQSLGGGGYEAMLMRAMGG